MPFDQFTIEQLAGDLLPDATRSNRIATGFNRNHMINNETGIVQEEFRVEYVADRVKTTSTVWMGLTVGCARCHDHKFDPIPQRDFYRLFAFFNNVPENGLGGSRGNAVPVLRVPTPDHEQSLLALDTELAAAKNAYAAIADDIRARQAKWEQQAAVTVTPAPKTDLLVHFPFDGNTQSTRSARGSAPSHPSTESEGLSFVPGPLGDAVKLDYGQFVESHVGLPIESGKPFSLGAWVRPARSAGCIVSKTDDDQALRGFDLSLRKGRLQFHLIHRWSDNALEVVTRNVVPTGRWQHLFVTYDGSGADGVKLFIDGQSQQVDIKQDSLTGSVVNDEPLRVGRRKASASFAGRVDDLRIYDRTLSVAEVLALATSQLIGGVTARPADKRDPHLAEKLKDHYLTHHAPPAFRTVRNQLRDVQSRRDEAARAVPVTMVMQEREQPRDTFVLKRGVYDQPGEAVTAGVPSSLGRISDDAPLNRLGLARWLTSANHPLTARVTVNRIWQQFFGTGLVRTTEDFGTQGELPSHPDLLDWLAVEFIESGWDVKQLVRLIVHSATYRQSSDGTLAQFAEDPLNRNLARGPRFRLDAECIRDQALAVSGLLEERIGGPSVKPYQPPGLWKAVSYDGELAYEPSTGRDLYRRSLYTYWKRQSPPPNMLTFDAGTRETCAVRRSRTNTPLQALVLMNDPVFVEAAKHLARRTLNEAPENTLAERAHYVFRLATARYPDTDELRVLTDVHAMQFRRFEGNAEAARQLLGDAKSHENPTELAAWTTVENLILSLDEVLMRR